MKMKFWAILNDITDEFWGPDGWNRCGKNCRIHSYHTKTEAQQVFNDNGFKSRLGVEIAEFEAEVKKKKAG